MRIGRLDVGLWKGKDIPWFEILRGTCGCYLITIFKICFTWMGDECYFNTITEERDGSNKEN